MNLVSPTIASSSQFYLIAVARGVDANTVATNTLTWQNGAAASNTIPIVALVLRKTGTLSLMIGTLRLNSTIIQPVSAASSALLGNGADPLIFLLDTNTSATVLPISANWDVNITTFNGTASTIDVEIYGFRLS